MVKVQKDATTEERILMAAREEFVSSGLAGARMQEIANRAGINKALLHYYFRSKEKLFETVFAATMQEFLPSINAIFGSDLGLFEKIEAFCNQYIEKILQNPFIPLFVLNELNQQPEQFIKNSWGGKRPNLKKLFVQIEEEVGKGSIRPIHPAHLIMNIIGMCVFPFIGKPLLNMMMTISEKQFVQMMEERKELIPELIRRSIQV